MYSVLELSKMFNTTRKTIYTKLKNKNIQKYIVIKYGGIRLKEEGLKEFEKIMSSSKIYETSNKTKNFIKQEETFIENSNQFYEEQIDYLKQTYEEQINYLRQTYEEQINILKRTYENQSEILKDEVKYLKDESIEKNTQLNAKNKLLENMQILLKDQKLIIESKEKKYWWQFWKK